MKNRRIYGTEPLGIKHYQERWVIEWIYKTDIKFVRPQEPPEPNELTSQINNLKQIIKAHIRWYTPGIH